MTKKIVEDTDVTPAAASLHPAAMPSDAPNDPSKSALMAQAIAIMGGIEKGDLSKFLESLAQIGHEADELPGNANPDLNRATVAAKPSDAVKEDVATLFVGEDLTEEFKLKAASLVEDAVAIRLALKTAELDEVYTKNLEEAYAEVVKLEEEFETKLNEAYDEIVEDMTCKVDEYLNYVAEQWAEDNKVAIEAGIKAEMTESFMEGLKNLFTEHYIEIPEDKVDVVNTLSLKVEELEGQLNAAINETIELKNVSLGIKKETVVSEIAEGLLVTDQERLKTLAENIEFNGDLESFTNRLKVIRENYFNKTVTSKVKDTLMVEDVVYTKEGKVADAIVETVVGNTVADKYAAAIARSAKKL